MRNLKKKIEIENAKFSDIVDTVQSYDFLKRIYGNDVKISEWDGNIRVVRFDRPLSDKIPGFVKRFVHRDRIDISVNQTLLGHTDSKHEIENKIYFHMFGAHLFDMKSLLITTHDKQNRKNEMNIEINVNCRAPPFLKGKIENFMESEAKKDLIRYEKCVKDVFMKLVVELS